MPLSCTAREICCFAELNNMTHFNFLQITAEISLNYYWTACWLKVHFKASKVYLIKQPFVWSFLFWKRVFVSGTFNPHHFATGKYNLFHYIWCHQRENIIYFTQMWDRNFRSNGHYREIKWKTVWKIHMKAFWQVKFNLFRP